MNDVMRLEELHVAIVDFGSSKVITEQLNKLTCFARQLASNRVRLGWSGKNPCRSAASDCSMIAEYCWYLRAGHISPD